MLSHQHLLEEWFMIYKNALPTQLSKTSSANTFIYIQIYQKCRNLNKHQVRKKH